MAVIIFAIDFFKLFQIFYLFFEIMPYVTTSKLYNSQKANQQRKTIFLIQKQQILTLMCK